MYINNLCPSFILSDVGLCLYPTISYSYKSYMHSLLQFLLQHLVPSLMNLLVWGEHETEGAFHLHEASFEDDGNAIY